MRRDTTDKDDDVSREGGMPEWLDPITGLALIRKSIGSGQELFSAGEEEEVDWQ